MKKLIKINIIFLILSIVFSSFSSVFATDLQTSLKVVKDSSEIGYLEDNQGYIEKRIVSSDSENGEMTVQLSVNNKEKDTSTEIIKYENTEIFILVSENIDDEKRTEYFSYIDTLATKVFEQNENTKIGIIGIQGTIADYTEDEENNRIIYGENDESYTYGKEDNAEIVVNLVNNVAELKKGLENMNSEKKLYYSNLQAAIRLANKSFSTNTNKMLICLYDNVPTITIGTNNIFNANNENIEIRAKTHIQNIVNNTKSEILKLKETNVEFILLRPDNTKFDRKYFDRNTGELSYSLDGSPYVNELYGTLENPTYGKMYSLNNDTLEDIVTNYIYQDIIEEVRPSIKNAKIKDYFSKEILDNFEITIINNDTSNVDITNLENSGYLEWNIGELNGNTSEILEYKIKMKNMANTQLLNQIINISERTEFTYTNYLDEEASKTLISSPQIQLVQVAAQEPEEKDDTLAPGKLPHAGLSITLVCIIPLVMLGVIVIIFKYNKVKDI